MANGTNAPVGLSHSKGVMGNTAADEDAGLVSQTRKGDLDAFEQLVNKHQKRMLNVAYRMIGDYDEACEAVQDAFISAFKNIKNFRGQAKFTTWLTAITVNHSRNRLKQMRSRHGHDAFSLDDPVQEDDGEVFVDPPSKGPSAFDLLEKHYVQGRVQDCIKALEPGYREVIILRDLQDFSYEEISAMLKVHEGTVKSRLFRAREAIKDCLKNIFGEL
jgi:RNA polymerase sigma-70 factor (ECF subfamily)